MLKSSYLLFRPENLLHSYCKINRCSEDQLSYLSNTNNYEQATTML